MMNRMLEEPGHSAVWQYDGVTLGDAAPVTLAVAHGFS